MGDNGMGCSIVDALEDEFKGECTHYLSWCWRYTVIHVVSSVRRWSRERRLDATKVSLWICFFCNNQRLIFLSSRDVVCTTRQLEELFEARLQGVHAKSGHIVA